ncbi:MAG: DUF4386 domain-containing protein [Dehalococcoidia bacterium]|nr:DUF4386 domain-containing protein [Dehalococcoidia bacterium]
MPIPRTLHNPSTGAGSAASDWKGLYRVGAGAALLMAAFIPVQIIVFIIWPPPGTVTGWFDLYQQHPLVGLLDMDLLLIVDQVFVALIMVTLYVVLRRSWQSLMTIALTLSALGIAAYFASTAAFEMLSLSGDYAAATTEAQRATLLAAGQVMLSTWQGTAFSVGYVLEGIGLLLVAIVMLRSTVFSQTTARVGVVLGVMSLLPPTAGMVGMFFALGSLVPLEIWDILVARRLLRLVREASKVSQSSLPS